MPWSDKRHPDPLCAAHAASAIGATHALLPALAALCELSLYAPLLVHICCVAAGGVVGVVPLVYTQVLDLRNRSCSSRRKQRKPRGNRGSEVKRVAQRPARPPPAPRPRRHAFSPQAPHLRTPQQGWTAGPPLAAACRACCRGMAWPAHGGERGCVRAARETVSEHNAPACTRRHAPSCCSGCTAEGLPQTARRPPCCFRCPLCEAPDSRIHNAGLEGGSRTLARGWVCGDPPCQRSQRPFWLARGPKLAHFDAHSQWWAALVNSAHARAAFHCAQQQRPPGHERPQQRADATR